VIASQRPRLDLRIEAGGLLVDGRGDALHRLRVVLGVLAAQAIATELLFVSAW
jgi:hypothetical protein